MSQFYRGDPDEQTAMSRWFRDRWSYGSVYVLDLDRIVCRADLSLGLLIEEKHIKAQDRNWRITATIARRLGWYAALFVYTTDDGTPYGTVTSIDATWQQPDGTRVERPSMSPASFDAWASEVLGAVQVEQVA